MTPQRKTGTIEIHQEKITSAVAGLLIGQLNAELLETYPEPGATHFRLDPDEVGPGRGVFLVAYENGRPAGCGAVRRIDQNTAELKRMYVVPSFRRRGISRLLLEARRGRGSPPWCHAPRTRNGNTPACGSGSYALAGFKSIHLWRVYRLPTERVLGESSCGRPTGTLRRRRACAHAHRPPELK